MALAVVAALGAAVCSGLAAVLQAKAVARIPPSSPRPGLLLQLSRSGCYRLALLLVAAGFMLSLLALRDLPVFVVAVARASSLGVTALLAWPVLNVVPRRRELLAVGAMGAGLLLVVGTARPGPPDDVPTAVRVTLAVTLVVAVLLGLVLTHWVVAWAGSALAVVAGVDFALVGLAARTVDLSGLGTILLDPVAWVIVLAGSHGLLTYATALQRVAVTHATALMVGVETLVGALVGVLLLSDSSRPGWAPVSLAGFALALGSALRLATEPRIANPTSRLS
jgi:hypothetical protein